MMHHYLVLDIETSPVDFDSFDEAQQEYLLRSALNEEDQQRKKSEMALAPFTGHIVCIAIIHYIRQPDGAWKEEKRVCLMRSPDIEEERQREDLPSGALMIRSSEKGIVQDFWKYVRSLHDGQNRVHYITFNGRGFDFPFLMLRSAVLGLRPSTNLMSGTRWSYRETHTDLLDELTFQMPSQNGATRRFNLDFYTKSFGIRSPKGEGVDGSKVGELYSSGAYVEIAEYCLRDVQATWELFLVWLDLLKM